METSRNRLSRRVSSQSLYSDFGSLWKNGRYRVSNRERLQSIPYLDITLGTTENATFLLRGASIPFIFRFGDARAGGPPLPIPRGVSPLGGAPSFRVLCERVGNTDANAIFQPSEAWVLGSHPCQERKDGAPSVVAVSKKERRGQRQFFSKLFGR